jgi:hypothetical protein
VGGEERSYLCGVVAMIDEFDELRSNFEKGDDLYLLLP